MKLPAPILFRVVRTAALVWVVVRVALLTVGLSSMVGAGLVAFLLIVVGATWVDVGNARERLLYANLGVSPQVVMLIALAVALVLEFTIGLAVGAYVPSFTLGARL